MAAAVRKQHPDVEVELIGAGRGDFEVTVGGRVIFDKHAEGERFPSHDEILAALP